jgi:preprotein translocase subunit SecF
MTTTTPAPPPDNVPGVTRRHRPSDLYHERTNFQFIAHSRRWLVLSVTFVVVSIALLGLRGLNLGIDFRGGTSWQVDMQGGKVARIGEVRDLLGPLGFDDAKVSILSASGLGSGESTQSVRVEARVVRDAINKIQRALSDYAKVTPASVEFVQDGAGATFTVTTKPDFTPSKEDVTAALAQTGADKPQVTVAGREITVKVAKLPPSPITTVAEALAKYANAKVPDVSIKTVGPTWGQEVSRKAIRALIIFFLLLAAYLSFRFEWKMSVAAIIAVAHDIVFTVGVYALFRFPVTPATVTAFLTILGFSLYDTVVVFDKVTEFQRSFTATGRLAYGEMVNRSLNAVLMRSLSTTLVALLPVVSLLFIGSGLFGANALEEFAIALAAGLFIGSYSSLFVAAPLLAWWKEKEPQYRVLAERRRRVSFAAASVATGVPVVPPDELARPDDLAEPAAVGVPGPPAVPRGPIQPRARQQRRRKRR